MRTFRPSIRSLPRTADVLWVLLLAAVLAPLPASLPRWWMPLPLGFTFGQFAGLALALAAGWVAWHAYRARRDGVWIGVRHALAGVAATAVLSTIFAVVIEQRSNGFYSEIALFEGMILLLLLHLAATLLRVLGGRGNGTGARAHARAGKAARLGSPDVQPITAGAFADQVTSAVAWLVVAFWVLVTFAAREVALAILLLATGCAALVVILCFPDAVRGTRTRSARVRDDHARAT